MPPRFPKSSSKLKFLLDENIPRTVHAVLSEHDVIWVGRDLRLSSDLEIYRKAIISHRILLTLDKDFAHLRLFQKTKPTIVLLRFTPQRPEVMARKILEFTKVFSKKLIGKLIVVSATETLIYP